MSQFNIEEQEQREKKQKLLNYALIGAIVLLLLIIISWMFIPNEDPKLKANNNEPNFIALNEYSSDNADELAVTQNQKSATEATNVLVTDAKDNINDKVTVSTHEKEKPVYISDLAGTDKEDQKISSKQTDDKMSDKNTQHKKVEKVKEEKKAVEEISSNSKKRIVIKDKTLYSTIKDTRFLKPNDIVKINNLPEGKRVFSDLKYNEEIIIKHDDHGNILELKVRGFVFAKSGSKFKVIKRP